MGLLLLIIFSMLIVIGSAYGSIRGINNTYDEEIAAELKADGQGWKLVSVYHPSPDELFESPYHSFFKFHINGAHSSILIAKVRKGDRTIELWVRVNTFMFWITSIEYQPKIKTRNRKGLTQEQIERLL